MKIRFRLPFTLSRAKRLIPLDDTNLPIRTVKPLKRQGIIYLNDLKPDSEKYIRNFGKKSQQYVEAEKKRLGI